MVGDVSVRSMIPAAESMKGHIEVVTEDPAERVWKSLRLFTDTQSVALKVCEEHGVGDAQKKNAQKQAHQIAYCIRQAEEYFRASSQVGLATRPNLLYYGAVSLTRALVLLRKDGNYSFDMLRKKRKHQSHGLKLESGKAAGIRPTDAPADFLRKLRCSPRLVEGTPSGHFPLFYTSLVPPVCLIPVTIRYAASPTTLRTQTTLQTVDTVSPDAVAVLNLDGLTMMALLPDMHADLSEHGLRPEVCEGGASLDITVARRGTENVLSFQYDLTMNGVDKERKSRLKHLYTEKNPQIQLAKEFEENMHFRLSARTSEGQVLDLWLPEIVDDIKGGHFYILDPETYMPEPAAFLAVLFCLGTLARYYPDVWMGVVDESVRIAELVNSFLDVAQRKLPVLVLDQLTKTKHWIHP